MRIEKRKTGSVAQQAVGPVVSEPKKRRWFPKFSFRGLLRLTKFLIFLGVVLVVVLFIVGIPKRFNILVIGSDQRAEERGRSDVLMVVSIPKSPKQTMSIITIPRDTRVDMEGYGIQKITHAYALGEKPTDGKELGNADLTKQTVEELLSITIHGTVEVTFDSFQAIIDKLGGVTLPDQGKIDGEKALKIVRDRFREGGDFARTEDQREVFTQTVREIRAKNAYSLVYNYLKDAADSRISIPMSKFLPFMAYAIIRRGGRFSLSDAHNDFIPGKGQSVYTPEFGKELYYWIPDEAGTQALVEEWLS